MKLSKNKIYIIIIDLLVLVLVCYSNKHIGKYIKMKKAVNQNVYYNLKNFKEELQDLNKNISSVLTVKDNYNNTEFITSNTVGSYLSANRMTEEINNDHFNFDYIFLIYFNVNENVESILSDNIIDDIERQYLTALVDYNNELLKECKNIMGKLYNEDTYDYDYEEKIEKKILKSQQKFSEKANEILTEEKYSILKGFKRKNKKYGNETIEDNFEQIKTYCEDVLSTVIPDTDLKYNNKDKNMTDYVFETHKKNKYEEYITGGETPYKLIYDRNIKDIELYAVSYITHQNDKVLNENEFDETAQNIVNKFSDKAYLYDKKVIYDENGEGDRTYKYIEKNDDIYYEGSKISITMNKNKKIIDFYLGNSNKYIIPPSITKKHIENKIEGEILDIITIVNQKGAVEYEAHIREDDIIYAAVFDGYDGSLEYYGNDIRDYGKIKE